MTGKVRNENLIICQSVGVSFVGTLQYQVDRKGLPLQDPTSSFNSCSLALPLEALIPVFLCWASSH